LELPPVFGDHLVLQRERDIAVWGQADPGQTVNVAFRGRTASATAGAEGAWRVSVPSGEAGGPFELTVSAGAVSRTLRDVLVGEVWVGSGQSNMAGGARAYLENDPVLAAAVEKGTYPRVRLFRSLGLPRDAWTEATPSDMEAFSALLLAFGLRLEAELDVPVGLVVGAVGGTAAASWIRGEALRADPACQEAITEHARTYDPKRAQARYARALENWEEAKSRAVREASRPPRKPSPPAAPGQHNRGGQVGDLYGRLIRPVAGYTIRGVLWDQGEAGSGLDGVELDLVMGALIRDWREQWGQGAFPWLYVEKPSGGGPAFDPEHPVNRGAEPFAAPPERLVYDGEGRAVFYRIRNAAEQTWMVPVSDLAPGIHPPNKSGYAARAAQIALRAAYGREDVPFSGPVFREQRVDGNAIRVKFDRVGGGLAFRGGEALQGFQVAGGDGIFRWARAEIVGRDEVVVRSEDVPDPQHVRYAWARHRPWANLFGGEGLPAESFTTE
jgi:sialate O-acetylesterase